MANPDDFQRWLMMEKSQRGAKPDALVFTGPSKIARYFWCGMRAVFEAREQEVDFYIRYLECKLELASHIGLAKRFPKSDMEALRFAAGLGITDLEDALKRGLFPATRGDEVSDFNFVFRDGTKYALIKPGLSPERLAKVRDRLAESGVPEANIESFPEIRGTINELVRGEKYQKATWHFEYGPLVVVAEPDGITDEFVYEFKTIRSMAGVKSLMTSAHLQADLYGLLFGRKLKRVQILVMENNKLLTWHEPVNVDRAREVLDNFIRVEQGWLPQTPRYWKCERCEYKPRCPITPTAFNLKLWDDL